MAITTMTPDERTDSAVRWLLDVSEPAIRCLAERDLLGKDVTLDAGELTGGPLVGGLISGQQPDGNFGGHPYAGWGGAHWRLAALVDLGLPPGNDVADAALDAVLEWLVSKRHRSPIVEVNGLTRRCASQEGNAVRSASLLDRHDDERVHLLVRSLVSWQWPDGGWNCDKKATGRRSSFHETWTPALGLWEFSVRTGDREAGAAALRAGELFLSHRVHLSSQGSVIHHTWTKLRYPAYWHYGVLPGLEVLRRLGLLDDPRAAEALDLLESAALPDGRWRPNGYWWHPPGTERSNTEVVDWGRGGPNEMLTLVVLRILAAAGRR